jgi:hypothetical protein
MSSSIKLLMHGLEHLQVSQFRDDYIVRDHSQVRITSKITTSFFVCLYSSTMLHDVLAPVPEVVFNGFFNLWRGLWKAAVRQEAFRAGVRFDATGGPLCFSDRITPDGVVSSKL